MTVIRTSPVNCHPPMSVVGGDVRYSDYLLHNDDERKRQYLARHQHQDWTNPRTAAFWSRFVSWNRPTMRESLREIKQLFDIDVRLV